MFPCDLSDLEANLRRNIARGGLEHRVKVYPTSSAEAPAVAASELNATLWERRRPAGTGG